MPTTVKLSRRFYEQFGDDLATEFVDWFNTVDATYRTELRDLNELNFARFDAKLEQRFAEQDAKWERRSAEQDVRWERRLAEQDVKWERRLAEQDVKWERRLADQDVNWEHRLADQDVKWGHRLGELNEKMERGFADLRIELHKRDLRLVRWMFVFWSGSTVPLAGLMIALPHVR